MTAAKRRPGRLSVAESQETRERLLAVAQRLFAQHGYAGTSIRDLGSALGVALLLNKPFRAVGLFRGLFYLPSLLGGSVALAIVWVNMFNREGAFNSFLALFGIQGLGNLVLNAAKARDFPMLEAGVLVMAAIFVLSAAAGNLIQGLLDPRQRRRVKP